GRPCRSSPRPRRTHHAPRTTPPHHGHAGAAYNTVHTILKRLYDKGLVLREVDGRRGAYRPAKNAAELTAQAMHDALDRGPDPIAALQQFVTGLSPEEERALRELLTGGAA
ncbi:BlaI/MecI/CopY family transcriptional regulator, partial [Streptomyces sp. NPDC056159]|uniref:BlaI/MecI/CopY family transcriptional regulator n=1 Tax=Streptomyces sp. NPDC056159 TaxID=3155537 RepID=UPI0034472F34